MEGAKSTDSIDFRMPLMCGDYSVFVDLATGAARCSGSDAAMSPTITPRIQQLMTKNAALANHSPGMKVDLPRNSSS